MPRKGPLGNFDLDEGPDAAPVSEQIIGALIANAGKVIDLFRSWDDNGDGKVTRAEFHKAMIELGLEVPKDSIDSIFSRWDKDGGGELSALNYDRSHVMHHITRSVVEADAHSSLLCPQACPR